MENPHRIFFSFTIISRASGEEKKRYSVLMGQTVQTLKSPSRVEHFDFAIIPATETFFFYSSTDRMGWSRGRPLLDLMILLHRRKKCTVLLPEILLHVLQVFGIFRHSRSASVICLTRENHFQSDFYFFIITGPHKESFSRRFLEARIASFDWELWSLPFYFF